MYRKLIHNFLIIFWKFEIKLFENKENIDTSPRFRWRHELSNGRKPKAKRNGGRLYSRVGRGQMAAVRVNNNA